MKTKQAIAALTVLLAAGTAGAQDLASRYEFSLPGSGDFVSTKTRAQVIAELKEAEATNPAYGLVDNYSASLPQTSQVISTRTRAEVRNEAAQAQDSRPYGWTY